MGERGQPVQGGEHEESDTLSDPVDEVPAEGRQITLAEPPTAVGATCLGSSFRVEPEDERLSRHWLTQHWRW